MPQVSKKKIQVRRRSGATIAESAASLALLLPLTFMIIFAVLEASYAFMIKNSLSQGARRAARDLSIAYGEDPAIASSRALQETQVFDNIRIVNIINDSDQFDDPVWDTVGDPPTVTVNVRYQGGQYSLPPFPNPDPLGLGSTFIINAGSSYRL